MENKELKDTSIQCHEMIHTMHSPYQDVDRMSYREFERILNRGAKPSRSDKVRIITPKPITPNSYSNISEGYTFQQPVIDLAHKKNKSSKLVQKVTGVLNNPKFVETAQKVLYGVGVAEVVASSLYGIKVGDSGNEFARNAGLLGTLISAFGLYATYKFAKASSDVCTPLINFDNTNNN